MLQTLNERDDLIEVIPVQSADGRALTLEALHHRLLMRNAIDGSQFWVDGMTWYRCGGIEVTPQADGTWASDGSPRLVLTRR